MNKINWDQYADYIFCINYLPNNKLNSISDILYNEGINIYDNSKFSFIYDVEHKLFMNEFNDIKENTFKLLNLNKRFNQNNTSYVFYVGMITYKILKIAQYFKYKKIIIFEDDIIFLKDKNYLKNALDFINNEDFDLCMCQTTFLDNAHGNIEFYKHNKSLQYLGTDMFMKTSTNVGIYGGSFMILTDTCINKLIDFFEIHNVVTCLDNLDGLYHILNLTRLFALKPLCIQSDMLSWTPEQIKLNNVNMNINEYI